MSIKLKHIFKLAIISLATVIIIACNRFLPNQPAPKNMVAFEKYFQNAKGCFLVYDLKKEDYIVKYNEAQCKKRLSPESTFKIPNALIALDMGILKDENTKYKWDGTKKLVKVWEQDHTLASAISNSVVWYFQKVAAQVGSDAYKKYLKEFDYGNQDISGGLTKFWLRSSLKISAEEQINFLNRLYRDRSPVSAKALAIVKKIIVQEKSDGSEFSGKTGTADVKGTLGWFVGHVYSQGREFTFVVNMEAQQGATGQRAKAIAKALLQELHFFN